MKTQHIIQTLAAGRTAYGVARELGLTPGTPEFRATKKRWQQWLAGEALGSLERLAGEARVLNYEITLTRINE